MSDSSPRDDRQTAADSAAARLLAAEREGHRAGGGVAAVKRNGREWARR